MAVARRSSLLCVALLISCLLNIYWFQRDSATRRAPSARRGAARSARVPLQRAAPDGPLAERPDGPLAERPNGPMVEQPNGPLAEQLNDIETMLEKIVKGLRPNASPDGAKRDVVCKGNQWVPDPETPLFKEWGKDLPTRQKRRACASFLTYGYNAYLSDRLPLDREVPDHRPAGCSAKQYPRDLPGLSLVLIFYNEAVSILLRAITSAVLQTPRHLLREIILVDDCSDYDDLVSGFSSLVDELAVKFSHVAMRVERHAERRGLSASRVTGIRAAAGPVVAVMDAHVEFPVGWAEPILSRIHEDRRVVVSTVFDNTHYDTLVVHRYESQAQTFTWQLWCTYREPPLEWIANKDPTAPIRSPIVMGCMAASKSYLEEIGFLDEGMEVYGGENVELGLRVWQCGGRVEVLPCSRLAHIERYFKPYAPDLSIHMRRNALRVAEIWMDEYKRNVYLAWNKPVNGSGIDIGDISERVALRKRLNCKSFEWYLENVLPSLPNHKDIVQYGVLRSVARRDLCMDRGDPQKALPIVHPCHGFQPQLAVLTSARRIMVGFNVDLPSPGVICIGLSESRGEAALLDCELPSVQDRILTFESGELRSGELCLEAVEFAGDPFGVKLLVRPCSGTQWVVEFYSPASAL